MSISIEKEFCYNIVADKAIDDLRLKVDWNKVLTILTKHKIFLNNYQKISQILPDDHKEEYENNFLQIKSRRQRYLEEIKKITHCFREANIRFILEKGIAFSHTIYDDLYLRETSDIDLLIYKKDISKVDAVLREINYIPERDGKVFGYPVFKGYKPPNSVEVFDYIYNDGTFEMYADVQTYIQGVYDQNIKDFFHNTSIMKIDDYDVEIFSHESNFIHLMTHVYVHTHVQTPPREGKVKLRDYYDIKTFFQKYKDTLNWDEIEERVERYEIKALFNRAFMDVNEVFPNIIPNSILNKFDIENENVKWVENLCLYNWKSSVLDMMFNPNKDEAAEIIFKNSYSDNNINFKLPFDIRDSSIIGNFIDEKYGQLRFQYQIKSDGKRLKFIYRFTENILDFLHLFHIVMKFLVKDNENGVYQSIFTLYTNEGILRLKNEKSQVFSNVENPIDITKLLFQHGDELHLELPYNIISEEFLSKANNKICYSINLLENIQDVIWMPIDEMGHMEHSPKVMKL